MISLKLLIRFGSRSRGYFKLPPSELINRPGGKWIPDPLGRSTSRCQVESSFRIVCRIFSVEFRKFVLPFTGKFNNELKNTWIAWHNMSAFYASLFFCSLILDGREYLRFIASILFAKISLPKVGSEATHCVLELPLHRDSGEGVRGIINSKNIPYLVRSMNIRLMLLRLNWWRQPCSHQHLREELLGLRANNGRRGIPIGYRPILSPVVRRGTKLPTKLSAEKIIEEYRLLLWEHRMLATFLSKLWTLVLDRRKNQQNIYEHQI